MLTLKLNDITITEVKIEKGCEKMKTVVFISIHITLVILFVIDIIEMWKLVKQSRKITTLEDYNRVLLRVNDNISGFKHDFSNFIQALDGYVETNNMSGVRTMSSSILKECVETRNLEKLSPNAIKDAAVYSIILKKYFLAQTKNVNMNIEILTDLEISPKDSYTICRILAILLDNAIEAASQTEDGEINVRILKDGKVERKDIVIENTYSNKEVDLDKIFERGFTSKDNNLQGHGLGLWNIRKMLKNRSNLNLYTSKGELFSQQLEIY